MADSPGKLASPIRRGFRKGQAVSSEAKSGKTDSDDPLGKSFVFPNLTGKSVLIVGVGGGCDIITAFALAQMLKYNALAKLVYANTKTNAEGDLERLSAHVLRVPPERIALSADTPTHGTTLIDQSVPRGDDGCPLILELPNRVNRCLQLVAELQGMPFDMVFSVDTGADSIVAEATSGPQGRDQLMMKILAQVGRPWFHFVVSPGCDGETSYSQIKKAVKKLNLAKRYLGCFSIEPMLPVMCELSAQLSRTRTPNIIVDAFSGALETSSDGRSFVVPRGDGHEIPKRWLSVSLVIGPGQSMAQQLGK